MDLTIIIPIYNEFDALQINLPLWLELSKLRNWNLILVDDGSTDGSGNLLDGIQTHENARVIHHKVNRGYGGALKTGLKASTTEFSITIDADGQHTIESIDSMIQSQQETNADMVIGSRTNTAGSTFIRSLGKTIIRGISKILIPNKISDLNSGMKLYITDIAKRLLSLCPDTMAFSDVITLSFLIYKYKVVESPIEVLPRKMGKSTINIGTAIDTLIEIINIVMFFNPLRIFIPTSLFLLFVGLAWGLPIIFMGRGVSVGAMLAIVASGLCLLLGLIAEQLSQTRKIIIENSSDR